MTGLSDEKIDEYKVKAGETIDELKVKAGETVEDLKEKAEVWKDKAEDIIGEIGEKTTGFFKKLMD